MFAIPASQTNAPTIKLQDSGEALSYCFDLLQCQYSSIPDRCVCIEIPKLADKYDIPVLPKLMFAHLLEKVQAEPCSVLEAAYALNQPDLCYLAIEYMDNSTDQHPADCGLYEANTLGLECWHGLMKAVKYDDKGNTLHVGDSLTQYQWRESAERFRNAVSFVAGSNSGWRILHGADSDSESQMIE